jgi:hypothetical protein
MALAAAVRSLGALNSNIINSNGLGEAIEGSTYAILCLNRKSPKVLKWN